MKSILVILRGNINTDARVKKEIDTFVSFGLKVTLALWNWTDIAFIKEGVKIIDLKYGIQKSRFGKAFTFIKIVTFWRNVSKIVDAGGYDYVHCNDLNTLGVVFFARKSSGTCYIYDAHELFPEQYPKWSIRYGLWTWVERRLIARVRAIITTERNRADYLTKKYGLIDPPYVINNYPLYQVIAPKDVKSALNLEGRTKIICYSGLILRDRGLETIVKALERLPKDYYLLIIGYAFDQKYMFELKEYIKAQGQGERVHYYGPVPPEDLLPVLAGCDVSIALYERNGLNNYYCSPNKVFDSIMAGIKVITNDYPSLQMLKDHGFVRLISEIEPKRISDAVIELIAEDCKIPEDIKKIFSWQSLSGIFKKIYPSTSRI